MKKPLTKTVTTVKKPHKYTKKLKEKQTQQDLSTKSFVDKINYFKEMQTIKPESEVPVIVKDFTNTLNHIKNEYSEKYNIKNNVPIMDPNPINFLIKTSLNARDDLPVDKVDDISFQWDLKKSFWSNKLVFDRKPLKHSTEADFSITFCSNRLDFMSKTANLILSKLKFDVELVRFDEFNTKISHIKMINSYIKSATIPESRVKPLFGSSNATLILNFVCDHVVVE